MKHLPINQWRLPVAISDIYQEARYVQWIANTGSMTRQMQLVDDDALNIRVISACHQKPGPEEAAILGLKSREWPYIREVFIEKNGHAWLYGRSVFPLSMMKSPGRRIKLQGKRPLGKLLFKTAGQPRKSIEIARIDRENMLYQCIADASQPDSLLARRSVFDYQGHELLVQEVFLAEHPLYYK